MLNVLYILEALRLNNIMPGILPGRIRKDIEQQPNFFFQLRMKMLNLLYILEAVRHNNFMPGLLSRRTGRDIEQLPYFFCSATDRKVEHVIYPTSAQA